jgi:hypothetical protein
MYEAGHEVPYYQPEASLELFRRVLGNKVLADGKSDVVENYDTNGDAKATHTEPYVAISTSRGLQSSTVTAVVTATTGTVTGTAAASSSRGTAAVSPIQSSAGRRRVSMFWRSWL